AKRLTHCPKGNGPNTCSKILQTVSVSAIPRPASALTLASAMLTHSPWRKPKSSLSLQNPLTAALGEGSACSFLAEPAMMNTAINPTTATATRKSSFFIENLLLISVLCERTLHQIADASANRKAHAKRHGGQTVDFSCFVLLPWLQQTLSY